MRAAAAIWLGVLAFLLAPRSVSAHAVLLSSQPAAGASVGIAPGAVVLEFSEPLSPKFSKAEVTDPTGQRFSGGPSTQDEMRIPVSGNAPGAYTVDWTSVSATDGHQLAGSLQFGVRVAVGDQSAAGTQLEGDDLLLAIARWAEVIGLMVAGGMVVLGALASRPPSLAWVRPRHQALSLALGAGLLTVWGEAARAAGGPNLAGMVTYLTTGTPGYSRIVRLTLELLAVICAVRGASLRWLGALLVGALTALAASGHAASLQPAWEGIVGNAVHLIAAAVWAGSIVALAWQRPPSGWRSNDGRALLIRFSPLALVAFATTVVFGLLQALQEVGSVRALSHTSYGATLLVKVALIASMIPLSLMAWRRRRPHFRVEATLATLVVAAAALLGSFPTPPAQVVASSSSVGETGLPHPGELTLGDHAGSVVVGLTLDPGRPGNNRLILYLLPLRGPQAASEVTAFLAVDGTEHPPLSTCGITCREATVVLHGADTIDVTVPGGAGGVASFSLPSLPAPDGSALLDAAQKRIHELRSYHLFETLSAGMTATPADYTFAAPNRFEMLLNGSQTIWIGDTRWTRDSPGQPWHVEFAGPNTTVPTFTWDYFKPFVDPRVVGTETVDSVPTTIVAFYGAASGIAVWFRLWIDNGDVVRQAQMIALGHFMHDKYSEFDSAAPIIPPAAVAQPSPTGRCGSG